MATERFFNFVGGARGPWRVLRLEAVSGESLESVQRIGVALGDRVRLPADGRWMLRGFTSNERYTTRQERALLAALQSPLARPAATCAALIPIRKRAAWWELAQDERRAVFEDQSQHIQRASRYLPAIARRLHHCRDLGESFDFLTWFEYAPADAAAFEELVAILRRTEEWTYVEREVDIRMAWEPGQTDDLE